jgi:hypothetical protein
MLCYGGGVVAPTADSNLRELTRRTRCATYSPLIRRPFPKFMVAWLCLFSFGLDMAVHALGSVGCVSKVSVCVERACQKNERGVCLASRHTTEATADLARDGHDLCQNQPTPCRDLPTDNDHDQAHHFFFQGKQDGYAEFMLPPVTMAVLPPLLFNSPVRFVHAGPDSLARPPDVLGRLATIVMIV